AARAAGASPDGRAAPVAVVPEPAGDAHVVRRTRRLLVAAAVAACFAVAGGLFGYSIAPRAPAGTAEFLAFVGRPHTRIVAFDASAPSSLAVAYRAGDRHAWIVGSGLKKPTGGHTYELWFRTRPDAPMQPAGV